MNLQIRWRGRENKVKHRKATLQKSSEVQMQYQFNRFRIRLVWSTRCYHMHEMLVEEASKMATETRTGSGGKGDAKGMKKSVNNIEGLIVSVLAPKMIMNARSVDWHAATITNCHTGRSETDAPDCRNLRIPGGAVEGPPYTRTIPINGLWSDSTRWGSVGIVTGGATTVPEGVPAFIPRERANDKEIGLILYVRRQQREENNLDMRKDPLCATILRTGQQARRLVKLAISAITPLLVIKYIDGKIPEVQCPAQRGRRRSSFNVFNIARPREKFTTQTVERDFRHDSAREARVSESHTPTTEFPENQKHSEPRMKADCGRYDPCLSMGGGLAREGIGATVPHKARIVGGVRIWTSWVPYVNLRRCMDQLRESGLAFKSGLSPWARLVSVLLGKEENSGARVSSAKGDIRFMCKLRQKGRKYTATWDFSSGFSVTWALEALGSLEPEVKSAPSWSLPDSPRQKSKGGDLSGSDKDNPPHQWQQHRAVFVIFCGAAVPRQSSRVRAKLVEENMDVESKLSSGLQRY
ncbi:hypothetical protein DFH07DRAFT_776032 [Mycena maculata]|uniref:Uncharacterized protein n=1 Tax=Mycena maculata TaxID=230809 RepID=A0AAD7IPJ4_9AGAR|nr:hypothetical protein DFH07DRAFT_776032 [Mycena maculata]